MAVTRAVRQPLMTLLMGTPMLKEQVDTLPGSRVVQRQEAPVVRAATLASVLSRATFTLSMVLRRPEGSLLAMVMVPSTQAVVRSAARVATIAMAMPAGQAGGGGGPNLTVPAWLSLRPGVERAWADTAGGKEARAWRVSWGAGWGGGRRS